jgi:tetratricopeptide (TPR) repeat protein
MDPGYVYSAQMAVICRDKKRLNELASTFSEYAAQNPDVPLFRCTSAYIEAELGHDVEARREFNYLTGPGFESLPRRGVDWPLVLMLLSEICCDLGDRHEAQHLYQLLLPFARRNLTSFNIVSFGSAGTYLGKLATLLENYDDAESHFEYAIRFNDLTGARPWLADAQFEYARMLLRRTMDSDIARASQLLDASLAIANTIGSSRLVAQIESLSEAQAGIDSVDVPRIGKEESGHRDVVASEAVSLAHDDTIPEQLKSAETLSEFQLHREGDYWTSTFRKRIVRLKHSKGLTYIQTLLNEPGREFHAMKLIGAGDPSQPTMEQVGSDAAYPDDGRSQLRVVADLGDAGEMLDATAKKAYRRRLAELNEDLVKAKELGNVDRATRLEDEIEKISRELRSAVGLMGRDRMAASASERARVNVTRAIKSAVDRIAEHDAEAGRLLSRAIRTGTFCCYLPNRDSLVH